MGRGLGRFEAGERISCTCRLAVLAEIEAEPLPCAAVTRSGMIRSVILNRINEPKKAKAETTTKAIRWAKIIGILPSPGDWNPMSARPLSAKISGGEHIPNTVAGEDIQSIVERRLGAKVHRQIADGGDQSDDDTIRER